MNFKKFLSVVSILILFFSVLVLNFEQEVFAEDVLTMPEGSYAEGQVLVKFKANRVSLSGGVGRGLMNNLERELNASVEELVADLNLVQVFSEVGESTEELIEKLSNDPNIEYVEPNYFRYLSGAPDPLFNQQWYLQNTGQSSGTAGADIDWLNAYDLFKDLELSEFVVAVIDSGVNYLHPDIANNMWDGSAGCSYSTNFNNLTINRVETVCPSHGWDFIDDDNNPFDEIDSNSSFDGHGTHVAGLISAEINNQFGIAGVSNNAKIMAIRAFGTSGTTTLDKIILGLDFAIQNGANIINASYGGGSPSESERILIQNFEGILVAAAGNFTANNDVQEIRNISGQNIIVSPQYPASYDLPNILSVGSTTRNDNLSSFSNFGLNTVDLAAPGSSIVSLSHEYDIEAVDPVATSVRSGTSFASPIVAGAVAVLKGIYPTLKNTDIKYAITEFGDPLATLSTNTKSGKRLNLFNTITAVPNIFVAGFIVDNLIPANQVTQNSIENVTVHFMLRSLVDQEETIPVSLSSFEYRVGNGQFISVADSSNALLWNESDILISSANFSESLNFSFNPKSSDLAPLNDLNNQLVQIRFRPKVNDVLGPFVVSEQFNLNTFVAPSGGGGGGGSARGGGGGGGGGAPVNQNSEPSEVNNSNLPETSIGRNLFNTRNRALNFSDVVGHWAVEYVNELFERGVVQGRSAGQFAPGDSLTRAEMVKIALESFDYDIASSFQQVFPDVNSSDWFALYLVTARNSGIVAGYPDGTFKPNDPISRVEALKILLEASRLNLSDVPASTFTDVARGQWFTPFVDFAYNRGIVSGKSPGIFAPSDNVTRAEMAKMAVMTLRIVENK